MFKELKGSIVWIVLFLILVFCTCDNNHVENYKYLDFAGNHGGYDIWIVKTNNVGDILWQNCYGGTGDDFAKKIQQTSDGGYVVTGYTKSVNYDVVTNHGGEDLWVIKLDSIGKIEWEKTFGGSDEEWGNSVRETLNGDFIIAGFSYSEDGDLSQKPYGHSLWILKLNHKGSILWQKYYGYGSGEWATDLQETADGNIIVSGVTCSVDGLNAGNEKCNAYIIKNDPSGNMIWYQNLGGSEMDAANSIILEGDNGYVMAGYSESSDIDASENHGGRDAWIAKLKADGSVDWEHSYGGDTLDEVSEIKKSKDGGYIAAGHTFSVDGDMSGNHGSTDYWIVKLNASGIMQWQKLLGGSEGEQAYSVDNTNDGGYIITGFSGSIDGDISRNLGYTDFWLVKLGGSGNIEWERSIGGSFSEYANSVQQTSDGGFIFAGDTYSNDGDIY